MLPTYHWSANSPIFELSTSSAEEINPKFLPPNAFTELTMPQKCVGSWALLSWTPLKELTQIS